MQIADLLQRNAELHADHPALIVPGKAAISHGALQERVAVVAGGLRAHGVGRGDRVALLARNGLLHPEIQLAAAWLGAAVVPLNTQLTEPELDYIVSSAQPRLAVADPELAATLAPVAARAGVTHIVDAPTGPSSGPGGDAGDDALIIYTSGTTGRPKGVRLSQHALLFNALTTAATGTAAPDEVHLSSTPLYHAAAASRVTALLVDGQTHVLMPSFDVELWWKAVTDHSVTSAIVVPTQLRRLVERLEQGRPMPDSLRLVIYGAAPTDHTLIARAAAAFACGLQQGYGLTEAVTGLTALTPADHDLMRERPALAGSCGRPTIGVRIQIRCKDGLPARPGEVGEVVVRSDKTMTGYWNDPAATATTLVDGWLHTGDLARRDEDGYLYLAGRAKDMLISGGVNIYPAEIERVLHEHEQVSEAAVVGVPHHEWGEVPAAYVIPTAGHSLDATELREFCATRLSRIKVPREIVLVDDFPRTATGKVRKTEIRRRV